MQEANMGVRILLFQWRRWAEYCIPKLSQHSIWALENLQHLDLHKSSFVLNFVLMQEFGKSGDGLICIQQPSQTEFFRIPENAKFQGSFGCATFTQEWRMAFLAELDISRFSGWLDIVSHATSLPNEWTHFLNGNWWNFAKSEFALCKKNMAIIQMKGSFTMVIFASQQLGAIRLRQDTHKWIDNNVSDFPILL